MRVIPVIDLKDGLVVRGIAGRRDEYRPLRGRLAVDADPVHVAGALVEQFRFQECYVADLNAIGGDEPDGKTYRRLSGSGLQLWVDAGMADAVRCRRLADFCSDGGPLPRIIAGLESLSRPEDLAAIHDTIGPERLVFSLDLVAGRPLSNSPAWTALDPEQIVEVACSAGVRSVIVLDLHGVGMRAGVSTLELCRRLRQRHSDIELITGGGVRSVEDLRRLADVGCDAALVASALHDGHLTAEDIAAYA